MNSLSVFGFVNNFMRYLEIPLERHQLVENIVPGDAGEED